MNKGGHPLAIRRAIIKNKKKRVKKCPEWATKLRKIPNVILYRHNRTVEKAKAKSNPHYCVEETWTFRLKLDDTDSHK